MLTAQGLVKPSVFASAVVVVVALLFALSTESNQETESNKEEIDTKTSQEAGFNQEKIDDASSQEIEFEEEEEKGEGVETDERKMMQAVLGMGCFWKPEAQYASLPGVVSTRVGYSGGTTENPTYESLGDHTEVIEITYDPIMIDYSQLLKKFWDWHDATVAAVKQYRSLILYNDDEQFKLALESIASMLPREDIKFLHTEIAQFQKFYEAESYHQKHYLRAHKQLYQLLGFDDTQIVQSTIAAKINAILGSDATTEMEIEELLEEWNLKEEVNKIIRDTVSSRERLNVTIKGVKEKEEL